MELQLTVPGNDTPSGSVEVSEATFGREYNEPLIHQVVTAYRAGGRAGTRKQKNRSDVSGGGKKPWKQKGTGRARAGTSRGPLWRAGGVTFAARPQDHSQKVNKKMFRGAMCSILSELVRQDRLIVVEEFKVGQPKTKLLLNMMKQLGIEKSALLISDKVDENLYLSARNLKDYDVRDVAGADPVSLIRFDKIVVTVDAVKQFQERLV